MSPYITGHAELKDKFQSFMDQRKIKKIVGKNMLLFPKCDNKHWTLYVIVINTLGKDNVLPSSVLYFDSLVANIPPDTHFINTITNGIIAIYKMYDQVKESVHILNYESNASDDIRTLNNMPVKVINCKYIQYIYILTYSLTHFSLFK